MSTAVTDVKVEVNNLLYCQSHWHLRRSTPLAMKVKSGAKTVEEALKLRLKVCAALRPRYSQKLRSHSPEIPQIFALGVYHETIPLLSADILTLRFLTCVIPVSLTSCIFGARCS